MQDRSDIQTVFGPVAQMGQRITMGAVSVVSEPLTLWKEHHFFATKLCWINIGSSIVTAVPWTIATIGDFPVSAGSVYRWTPCGSNNQYIAVIEDPSVAAITGYLFIGQSET